MRTHIAVFIAVILWIPAIAIGQSLPGTSTSHFAGSGVCAVCHSRLTDSSRQDVSLDTDWQSTMMANAARDPVWQMKVYSETVRNPQIAGVIENKCATCHMPMAHREETLNDNAAVIFGDGLLSADHPLNDMAMDGVSCTLCHQINSNLLGSVESYSGHFSIDESTPRPQREIFGPYQNPVSGQMQNFSGFKPVQAKHIQESTLCATCHTLYTPVLNDSGELQGEFPEQTPYLEWEHSGYAKSPDLARSCQDCHMPIAGSGVVISNRPNRGLSRRSPFSKHYFVGGNTAVLELLSTFQTSLKLTASTAQLSTTRDRTADQLENRAAEIHFERISISGSMLEAEIQINSSTGHKFPSGFPSRRAWIHFIVTDGKGQVVFESGKPIENGAIEGVNSDIDPLTFEPHYDVIKNAKEVQVYEIAMQDLRGRVTHTLLEAAERIKDNRLLPLGFEKQNAPPDIAVIGTAEADENFQAGSDTVRYQIEMANWEEPFTIRAELLYQTVSYSFWHDLMVEEEVGGMSIYAMMTKFGEMNQPFVISAAQERVE